MRESTTTLTQRLFDVAAKAERDAISAAAAVAEARAAEGERVDRGAAVEAAVAAARAEETARCQQEMEVALAEVGVLLLALMLTPKKRLIRVCLCFVFQLESRSWYTARAHCVTNPAPHLSSGENPDQICAGVCFVLLCLRVLCVSMVYLYMPFNNHRWWGSCEQKGRSRSSNNCAACIMGGVGIWHYVRKNILQGCSLSPVASRVAGQLLLSPWRFYLRHVHDPYPNEYLEAMPELELYFLLRLGASLLLLLS